MASRGAGSNVTYRRGLQPGDPAAIEDLVRATGFFSAEEMRIARELADDGFSAGASGHYQFLLAEARGFLAGYACFGRIPCTRAAWDLYWIAVAPGAQRRGVGRNLLARVEAAIMGAGGERIYADTSSRAQYAPTRDFYLASGFREAAHFPDFYGPGDGKTVFAKVLAAPAQVPR